MGRDDVDARPAGAFQARPATRRTARRGLMAQLLWNEGRNDLWAEDILARRIELMEMAKLRRAAIA